MNEQNEENSEQPKAEDLGTPPAPTPSSPSGSGTDPEKEQAEEEKKEEAKEEKIAQLDYDASGLDPDVDIPGTDKPMYGQMLSQYPGYNPYIFGAPDNSSQQSPKEEAGVKEGGENPFSDAYGAQGPSGANGTPGQNPQNFSNPPQNPGQGQYSGQNPYYGQPPFGNQQSFGSQPQNPYQQNPYGFGYGQSSQNSFAGRQENINTSDPRQNPYYGKVDGLSVIAFVASILGIWLVGLPLGIFSLIRVKQLHMRGKGLAIAAIVISCLYIVLDIVLFFMGITDQQIISWLTQKLGAGSGSGLRI